MNEVSNKENVWFVNMFPVCTESPLHISDKCLCILDMDACSVNLSKAMVIENICSMHYMRLHRHYGKHGVAALSIGRIQPGLDCSSLDNLLHSAAIDLNGEILVWPPDASDVS